jgi:hypothetical protein
LTTTGRRADDRAGSTFEERIIMKWLFGRARSVLPLLAATACGGSDETEGEKVCGEVDAKLAECNLQLPSGTRCNDKGDDATLCAARCLVDASCADIVSDEADTSYVRCVAACSGASPDDFICASGNAFVPAAGVCDGVSQCPDGSDEAGCDGAADGGTP